MRIWQPLLSIALLLYVWSVPARAGSDGAQAVLERFLLLNRRGEVESPEARALLTGEARERWRSSTIGELAAKPDKVVYSRDGHAVARVALLSDQAIIPDTYFYLVHEEEAWKIEAMRSPSQLDSLNMLRRLGERSPPPGWEQSKREIDLTLSSDRELQEWFDRNRRALRALASSTDQPVSDTVRSGLGVSRVEREGAMLKVVIGGIQDNTVGFLYSPGPPPQMSPDGFVWVEPVGDDWYFYRTT
jgi:hypothetical protein